MTYGQRDINKIKLRIIEAGHKAVEHLIKVAEEEIISSSEDSPEVAADKLKNAAAAKKLAIFDSFEILSRIESERESMESTDSPNIKKGLKKGGFAEGHSR